MKYHPASCGVLTARSISCVRTVAGGQFDWGGRLRKRNGGARMVPSVPTVTAREECNGRRAPDGESDSSSRVERRS